VLPSVGIVTVVTLWRNHMRSTVQVDAKACTFSPAKKSSSLGAYAQNVHLGYCDLTKVMVKGTSAVAVDLQTHPGCSADSRKTSRERLVSSTGTNNWLHQSHRTVKSLHRTVTVLVFFLFFFFFSRLSHIYATLVLMQVCRLSPGVRNKSAYKRKQLALCSDALQTRQLVPLFSTISTTYPCADMICIQGSKFSVPHIKQLLRA